MRNFPPLTVILGAALLVTGCSQKTIYSEMYSPKRNRFVATVERQTVTELPPEVTTTETTTIIPTAPMPGMDGMAVPEPATPPVIPGMEAIPGMEPIPAAPGDAAPAAPMDAAPMDAAPAAPMDAAPGMDAVPPAM